MDFGVWLGKDPWKGKEHDCVNSYAHGFLMSHISPEGPLRHPAQICIECGMRQPEGYEKSHARRDLVIWKEAFQNTWNDAWERDFEPLAFMEWKARHATKLPRKIFYPHDEEWVQRYTAVHPGTLGMVVAVYFLPEERKVFWKFCEAGTFGDVESSP